MEDNQRHRLELVGITYNQIESGVYAVVLREADGDRRIPIIVGFPEAQAIECKLQDVTPPRPLTHDLMVSFLQAFGITLREIEIRKLNTGVFTANLIFSDGEHTRVIDSRSSDGIALAIRAGAPIYTSEEVLREAGFRPEEAPKKTRPARSSSRPVQQQKEKTIEQKTRKELEAEMQKAAESEDYELAARLKAELDRRSEAE
ncbi:MAG: bifunctional nuclease family protein [Bacteroidales bacterium]|nr:bifunctional nuclease family protein [Bacteroidales bacterium]MDE7465996.1 bifunctional nuclease family protein [Muribaculaceae bacterium]